MSASDPGLRMRAAFAADGGGRAAFSSKVTDYVASRPDYAPALFDALRQVAGLSSDSLIADIGAGTGILTRGLLERGYRVIAVEPNAAMRAAADAALASHAGYKSLDGSAEALPLADGSIDLVTAAQAFHWFDPESARRECLRVLKPGSYATLIWNDRVTDDPLNQMLDVMSIRFGGAKHSAMAEQDAQPQFRRFFGEANWLQLTWPHAQQLNKSGLQSLVFSRSYIPARETETGRQVAEETGRLFDRVAIDGWVTVRYNTMALIGRPSAISID